MCACGRGGGGGGGGIGRVGEVDAVGGLYGWGVAGTATLNPTLPEDPAALHRWCPLRTAAAGAVHALTATAACCLSCCGFLSILFTTAWPGCSSAPQSTPRHRALRHLHGGQVHRLFSTAQAGSGCAAWHARLLREVACQPASPCLCRHRGGHQGHGPQRHAGGLQLQRCPCFQPATHLSCCTC